METLFNIDNTLFTLWNYPVSVLELWATLTGLACVVLARMNSRWNFPIGIINCIGFGTLFYQIQLYSDMLLQVYFIAVSVYGWFLWSKTGTDERKIRYMESSGVALTGFVILFGTTALALNIDHIMVFAGNLVVPDYVHVPAELSVRDAFTTVASVVAFFLMIRRHVEAWYLWCTINIICIANYLEQGVILMVVEYGVFLLNAVWALWAWDRQAHD